MKIFIASSSEGFHYAEAVQGLLEEKQFDAITWKDAEFHVGNTIIESFEKIKYLYDYAIFIFHPDDELNFRNSELKSVRDNVIFELGLFAGVLGIKKCFVLVPKNITIKQPSDLMGILNAHYKYDKNDNNIPKTMRTSISKIIRSIEQVQIEEVKSSTLIRGDYRNFIADASVSLDILDFEMYEEWVKNIMRAKRVKEELLYWERNTANRWIEYEKYTIKKFDHLTKLSNFLKDKFREAIDFISLGPGSGEKDKKIISNLISSKYTHWYYPIDISSHLLFQTLKKMTSEFDDTKLKVKGIRANFKSIERLKFIYQFTNHINVFLLLGNTLGNYNETELLNTIRNSMFKDDILVLELNRYTNNLNSTDKYSNSSYHDFILEPLKSIGLYPNKDQLKFEEVEENISSIDGAIRVSANYYLSSNDKENLGSETNKIMITHSTRYNSQQLIDHLKNMNFEIIYSDNTDDQIVIVLKNL